MSATHTNKWLIRLRWLTDGLVGASLGGAFYASWVIAVNWHVGELFALKVGAAHWCLSAFLTFYGTSVMRKSYQLCQSVYKKTSKINAVVAFTGGMTLTYGLLIPSHMLLGTPNIPLSLAAGVIPTFLFCFSYSILLGKTETGIISSSDKNCID